MPRIVHAVTTQGGGAGQHLPTAPQTAAAATDTAVVHRCAVCGSDLLLEARIGLFECYVCPQQEDHEAIRRAIARRLHFHGQALVEYALIVLLVALVVVAAVVLLGPQIAAIFQHIHDGLNGGGGSSGDAIGGLLRR